MTFQGTLKPFQLEAKDMMIERGSLLLAHRMGLGKTVTSIAACEELIDEGLVECVLVLAPASIKWQWYHQIQKFSDGALVKVIEGTKNQRRQQYRAVKRGEMEYVIMNYEQVVADYDIVRLLAFDAVVGDEIVAIKNPGTQRSRHVKRIQAPFKFGLSGQPIENKPEELFSIMEWIDPSVLGKADKFEQTFIVRNGIGTVKLYRNLKLLRRTMKTAMHRRTRKQVKDQMPALVHEDYLIDLDPQARKLYRFIAKELIQIIRASQHYGNFNIADHYAGVKDNGINGEVMPRLMALRMLCDHPALLDYSADQFDDPEARAGSKYIAQLRQAGLLDNLKPTSPKLNETLFLIDEVLDADPDNKVVLFSFFKPMLAIIGKKLHHDYTLYTGDLTPRERDASQQRFTEDPDCRVFLSSDAGGIGVDLPVANYLISYDLPWSAGKFEQREGRIDRISSLWPEITLLTMVVRNSIEERMLHMLNEKTAVAEAWLDGKGVDEKGTFTLSGDTLADFLEDTL